MLMTKRMFLTWPAAIVMTGMIWSFGLAAPLEIIDDLSQQAPRASNGASWELIADNVMGGVSQGTMRREKIEGRSAVQMQGEVSLENNGGFLQMAIDLGERGASIDASNWSGIEIDVRGNGETYNLHLRTEDVRRPWQSYRRTFRTSRSWTTIRFPFVDFTPYRIDTPLDPQKLRRIGIVAIGRAFTADIAISGLRFFK
jgi:hypothetical protein